MLSSTHVTAMDVATHKIGTSPYFYVNQRHIHLKYLHHLWTPVYFTVPPHERRQGKVGQAQAPEVKDPRVPTSYDKAIVIPLWAAAITTELGKFRDHNCLVMTPFTGQHLVPMKWIFSIKTDGTYKARLVDPLGRLQPKGDLMWQHHGIRN